ncbi:MAG: hypothetical protein ACJAVV_003154 [Alphaproteobacteria bacterium]|jgi:hypothetical protein
MYRKLENTLIKRYNNPKMVDHLASNYTLGLLTTRINKRIENLRKQYDYRRLDARILYWQQN